MNPISKETLPLLSFIVGLGVAILMFHKPYESRAILSLPVNEVEDRVIAADGKCFQYTAEDARCEILSSK